MRYLKNRVMKNYTSTSTLYNTLVCDIYVRCMNIFIDADVILINSWTPFFLSLLLIEEIYILSIQLLKGVRVIIKRGYKDNQNLIRVV